ncbi:hypothetical protein [Youxingia wuxianensis]|uniref:Uncharacterized protein n=1 Tax=Youxingia wuxianensis TaxID=2763678 RepID=A0A926EQT9_9FIRM|nr:hypothetical protein [Youxingia wuxianensis]MBC8586478.1 hypothetical protein [Youxingia wuxianensis]
MKVFWPSLFFKKGGNESFCRSFFQKAGRRSRMKVFWLSLFSKKGGEGMEGDK